MKNDPKIEPKQIKEQHTFSACLHDNRLPTIKLTIFSLHKIFGSMKIIGVSSVDLLPGVSVVEEDIASVKTSDIIRLINSIRQSTGSKQQKIG